MIEHAAAVAGATAGTAGGKALSNLLDKTLGKAAETGTQAATTKPDNKTEPNAAAAPAAGPEASPSSGTPAAPAPKRATRTARVVKPAVPMPDKPVFAVEESNIPAPVAAMVPGPPSVEDFAKVKEGGAREEVYAALGQPSSHITIPDDGHLIEILSYSDGARRIGTVRLDNGQVVSVTTSK